MLTLQQIRSDLKEIRYYYSMQKSFNSASHLIIPASVTEIVNKYNVAISKAPARLYMLYFSLYVTNNSQAALAEDWGFSKEYIRIYFKTKTDRKRRIRASLCRKCRNEQIQASSVYTLEGRIILSVKRTRTNLCIYANAEKSKKYVQ